jgi:phosphate-selective porin OprO/OprP
VFLQREGGGDLHFWGGDWYVAYMLTGEHMAWDREIGILDGVEPFENFFLFNRLCGGTGGGWGAWQVAARYSFLDSSDGNIQGGVGHNSTLGLVWHFNPSARLQFNWEHGWIVDSADLDAAALPEAEYDVVGLRAMIAF